MEQYNVLIANDTSATQSKMRSEIECNAVSVFFFLFVGIYWKWTCDGRFLLCPSIANENSYGCNNEIYSFLLISHSWTIAILSINHQPYVVCDACEPKTHIGQIHVLNHKIITAEHHLMCVSCNNVEAFSIWLYLYRVINRICTIDNASHKRKLLTWQRIVVSIGAINHVITSNACLNIFPVIERIVVNRKQVEVVHARPTTFIALFFVFILCGSKILCISVANSCKSVTEFMIFGAVNTYDKN